MTKVHLSGLSWRAGQGYSWGPADASKGMPYILFLKPNDWCMATYHIFNIKYLLWLYLLLCWEAVWCQGKRTDNFGIRNTVLESVSIAHPLCYLEQMT